MPTPPRRRTRTALVLTVLLATAFAPLAACSTNPATGRRQLNLLSRDQEIALGEEAKGELTSQFGGSVPHSAMQSYVTEVGMSLVPHTEGDFPTLPWEFTLLDSDVINAFALPGGKVFITRGLASKLETEAQLAGILGHEVGHVTAQHANRRISQQIGFTAIIVGASVAAGRADDPWIRDGVPLLVGTGGTIFLLSFNREEEIESDALGMRYMAAAGYDPRGQLEVMQILARESAGASRGLEFFSTHPHPETRVDRIRGLLSTKFAYTQGNPEFQSYPDRYQQRFLNPLATLSQSQPSDAERQRAADRFSRGFARFFAHVEGEDVPCPACSLGPMP